MVAALEEVDPDHRHLTPVVTTSQATSIEGPTVAVDAAAFPGWPTCYRGRTADAWAAIGAPRVDPILLTGSTVAGSVGSEKVALTGPSADRADDLVIGLQLLEPDGTTGQADCP